MDGIITFPLDNTEYEAIALGSWSGTRTRGVFASDTHFTIKPNTGLSVTVSPGLGWLKMAEFWGVSLLMQEAQVLTAAQSDGSLTRLDPVCLRIDKNRNVGELVLKTGAYFANPTVEDIPAPTQNLDYDEIFVGALRIRAGAKEILDTDIIDLRLEEKFCGIMRDGVTGIPTQALYDMWLSWHNAHKAEAQAYYANNQKLVNDLYIQYKAEIATHESNAQMAYDSYLDRIASYETSQKEDWETWVASLKDILGEEVAGKLQLEIEELQKRMPVVEIGTVSTLAATPQNYPMCAAYTHEWGFGLGGAGMGPAGGSSVVAIDAGFEYDGDHNVKVSVPSQYGAFANINQLSDTMYAFMGSDPNEVASLVVRIVKEA